MRCNPPVSESAGERHGAFGAEKAQGAPAPAGERPCVRGLLGARPERVGVERDNDGGVHEPRPKPQCLSVDSARRLDVVVVGRLEPMPAQIGVPGFQRGDLVEQGGRGDAAGQQTQACAFVRRVAAHLRPERAFESRPIGNLACEPNRLRAVGIIKAQDLGLREDVRAAQARGMVRVSLDFGWAPLEGGDDRAAPITAKR